MPLVCCYRNKSVHNLPTALPKAVHFHRSDAVMQQLNATLPTDSNACSCELIGAFCICESFKSDVEDFAFCRTVVPSSDSATALQFQPSLKEA